MLKVTVRRLVLGAIAFSPCACTTVSSPNAIPETVPAERVVAVVQLSVLPSSEGVELDAPRSLSLTVIDQDGLEAEVQLEFPAFTSAESMAARIAESLRAYGLLAAVIAGGRDVVLLSSTRLPFIEVRGAGFRVFQSINVDRPSA